MRILAHDAGVSIATGYRYLHEAIDVIAAHAPELPDVLAEALHQGWAFARLDGTLMIEMHPGQRALRCRARPVVLGQVKAVQREGSQSGSHPWQFACHVCATVPADRTDSAGESLLLCAL